MSGTKCKARPGCATTKCKYTQHEYSVQFFRGCYLLTDYLQFACCSEAYFHPQKNVPLAASHEILILYRAVISWQIALYYIHSAIFMHILFDSCAQRVIGILYGRFLEPPLKQPALL